MWLELLDSIPERAATQREELQRLVEVSFHVFNRLGSSACNAKELLTFGKDPPKRLRGDSALHPHKAGSGA